MTKFQSLLDCSVLPSKFNFISYYIFAEKNGYFCIFLTDNSFSESFLLVHIERYLSTLSPYNSCYTEKQYRLFQDKHNT